MTVVEMGKVFAHLKAGKPRFFEKVSEKELQVMILAWWDCLNDLSFEVVAAAVKLFLNSVPYMPEIFDIRQKATELMRPELTATPESVYNQITRAIALPGGFSGNCHALPPHVIDLVNQFGLKRLQFEDESEVKEAFLSFYRANIRREMTGLRPALQSGPEAKALKSAQPEMKSIQKPEKMVRNVIDLTKHIKTPAHVRPGKKEFIPKSEKEYAARKAALLKQGEALKTA